MIHIADCNKEYDVVVSTRRKMFSYVALVNRRLLLIVVFFSWVAGSYAMKLRFHSKELQLHLKCDNSTQLWTGLEKGCSKFKGVFTTIQNCRNKIQNINNSYLFTWNIQQCESGFSRELKEKPLFSTTTTSPPSWSCDNSDIVNCALFTKSYFKIARERYRWPSEVPSDSKDSVILWSRLPESPV